MTKRLTTLALGAALAIGMSAASYAQIGGSSGGASGNRTDDTSTMHGGTTGKGPKGSLTTGQGGSGATQTSPGQSSGAANGSKMKQQDQKKGNK